MTSFDGRASYQRLANRLLLASVRSAAALAAVIVLVILCFVAIDAIPALRDVGASRFVRDASWHPLAQHFNLVPMLIGTIAVSLSAVLVATPIGIASTLFCRFYAPPPVAALQRRIVEVLAGIPSVVYGFWGLVTLVPILGSIQPPGPSLLAGALILAIMILPTIALAADAAIAAVPEECLLGAAALGLPRHARIFKVVLPCARDGLFTGLLLETGRALGETMAVLMVCGNVVQAPSSLFAPIRTLAANIALEMAYAMGTHRSALFVSGLVLGGFVLWLSLISEVVSRKVLHG